MLFLITLFYHLPPVIELLAKQVWYRSKVKIRQLFFTSASQDVLALPPATDLPQEIVEMIIIHLIYDKGSLLACSLTCYSWYIAAVPHLHHTLVTQTCGWLRPKYGWPEPLCNASRLGLLPLVRKLQVRNVGDTGFSPKLFNRHILRQFSALANIQELEIDSLDIPSFIPRAWWYFGHFLPTARSLTLSAPKVPSADHILHRTISAPRRPYAPQWHTQLLGE